MLSARPFRSGRNVIVCSTYSITDLVHEALCQRPTEFYGKIIPAIWVNEPLSDIIIPQQEWTDGRSKLLQELLSSMAIIKQFTYELPFLERELSKIFQNVFYFH